MVCGLADGMGGHRNGSLASRTMVEECKHFLQTNQKSKKQIGVSGSETSLIETDLRKANLLKTFSGSLNLPEHDYQSWTTGSCLAAVHDRIVSINAAEVARAQQDRTSEPITEKFLMGTTGVLVHLLTQDGADARGTPYTVSWCGDSRLYHFSRGDRGGALTQITSDHNSRPGSHMLSYVLGIHRFHVDTQRGILRPGDSLLLCTDGLTNEVDDDQLAIILATTKSATYAANELLSTALDSGGRDNITVGVVHDDS
jgi:serine/threonine protein phosphatase PrpC